MFKIKRIPSKYIDKILPSLTPVQESDWLFEYPSYLHLQYISKQQMYIRINQLPKKYGTSHSISVLDKKLNVLDEILNDKWFCIIEGRLANVSVIGDSLEINFYDIVKTKQNHHTTKHLEAIKDSIALVYKNMGCKTSEGDVQKKNIQQYLNQQGIQDSSCSVVLVNVSGCPSCNEHTLNFLSVNKGALFNIENRPLYFIYIDENRKQAKNRLKQLGLNESERIKIDTIGFYDTFYSGGEGNPRLILKKDNQVIHDSIYNPSEITELQLHLINFYELSYE